jgi:hypothetical protein
VKVDLTSEQVRWLGGLLRGFCSDPIYDMEDDNELEERFLHLLNCEMEHQTFTSPDASIRALHEMQAAFGPVFPIEDDEEKEQRK